MDDSWVTRSRMVRRRYYIKGDESSGGARWYIFEVSKVFEGYEAPEGPEEPDVVVVFEVSKVFKGR
jgi:hypothetical protein